MSNDQGDALPSKLATDSNQTATIAVMTADVIFRLVAHTAVSARLPLIARTSSRAAAVASGVEE